MNSCPICNSSKLKTFIEIKDTPVYIGVQWPVKEQAMNCPKGDIRLAFCQECGVVTNLDYDPSIIEYDKAYDNSLHFSTTYQEYALSVAKRLIDRYGITNKQVIEIGSGKGEFLSMLCTLGNNKGFGFDPSFESDRLAIDKTTQITFIQDFYSEKYNNLQGDLICSRYVLEHVPDPLGFLNMVRKMIREKHKPIVYFEVPNVDLFLSKLSIWDIIYEHCTYFGISSLARAFLSCDFRILNISEYYDGQMVAVEAVPNGHTYTESSDLLHHGLEEMSVAVDQFENHYKSKLGQWNDYLNDLKNNGKKTVIWGAGAKGVSFLNLLDTKDIRYAVDINPHKHGRFIPGSGQQIVSPEDLRAYQPDVVIVMNPIYQEEIESELISKELYPQLIVI